MSKELSKVPKATYQSDDLDLNGFKISCAVLEDGRRVLVNRSLATAFGIKGSGAYWQKKKGENAEKGALLPEYLSAKYLEKFIEEDLYIKLSNPIVYENKQGVITEGMEAELLADICDIYVKAGEKGALKTNPEIAQNAYKMILAFSKLGIRALVDEATGYQKDKNRAKDELQKFLTQFMRPDAAVLVKRFEDSFFEMIYKMRGWTWNYTHRHPGVVGIWINDIVYERIAPLVLSELRKKNPIKTGGGRKNRHHQFLSDELGVPKLLNHLAAVEALGRASGFDWHKFMALLDTAFPKQYQQIPLFDYEEIAPQKQIEAPLSEFNKNLLTAINYNPPKEKNKKKKSKDDSAPELL
ncbi:MAG: hypothetical protein JNM41_04580 [Flavipsychrobacter sp.]|nr:hypothetical protein [Flavipsychrobacter sp.]